MKKIEPGTIRLSNGAKARQNKEQVKCPCCGGDTGIYRSILREQDFSDMLRDNNIKVHDKDFFHKKYLIDHTSTPDDFMGGDGYFHAINRRKIQQREYHKLLEIAKLHEIIPIVIVANMVKRKFWVKFVTEDNLYSSFREYLESELIELLK